MKKFLIGLLSLIIAMPLLADNTVTVSSVSGAPGDEVEVSLSLANTDQVVAAEVIIPLDGYVSYVANSATLNAERSNGHLISATGNDNKLKLYIYSITNNALKGNDGTLCTFKLKLGKRADVLALNPAVTLSNASGTAVAANVVGGRVSILVPELTITTPSINYGHVPIRATYQRNLTLYNSGTARLHITGIVPSVAELTVAETDFYVEVGESKSVTVSYSPLKHGAITETIRVLSDAANGTQTASVVADPYSVNELHIGSAEGSSDSEVTISVTLNNMEPIVAAQWSFNLPEALKYVDGSVNVGEHASGLQATASVSGKRLTLFLYSTTNAPIPEGDGCIATFRLELQGTSGTYYLTPQDIVLSNVKQENLVSASSGGRVVISSPRISGASSLNMGETPVTETASQQYSIRNNGAVPLVINRVTFLAEGFSIAEQLPLTIPRYSSAAITVQYQGEKEGSYATTMQVYSNDPETRMKSVAVSGKLYEPNVLSMTSAMCENTKDYAVTINLKNYSSVVAMQADIVSTKPFTLNSSEIVASDRLAGLSVAVSKMSSNSWRLLLFSMNNTPISGTEGDLLTLIFHPASAETNLDKAVVSLENIILSSSTSSNKYRGDVVSTELHLNQFTITSAGYATYYNSAYAVKLPAGLTGYIFDKTLQKIQQTYDSQDIIPADCAIVVKGAPGTYPLGYSAEKGDDTFAELNALLGTDEETPIPADDTKYFYGLSVGEFGVGFYWMEEDGVAFTNGAHKAYLVLDKEEAKGISSFGFDVHPTTVEGVEAVANGEVEAYDLMGSRVAASAKGLVIINGKKVFNK